MIAYASNKQPVGDGWRITRVSNGGQKLEVMVDEKTGRLSEIIILASAPPPPANNPPDITTTSLTADV